ncbi:MAG: zinc-ribbon domain-containing protein [Chitinophagaceae bacterium]|nr:zinc-ribbon domain-containing protein [Chitinophagaceae bacterium]
MAYCTKCGKQNSDTAKFCTSCGATLKSGVIPPIPTSAPNKVYHPMEPKRNSSKKSTWLAIGIISFLGLFAGVYFIFFNKKKSAKANEIVVETDVVPPADTTTSQADYNAAPEPDVSKPVPLNPESNITTEPISPTEVTYVSQVLQNFYQCENNEDISCLLDNYNFPVGRYYQLNNVSYYDLHKLFSESFNEKLDYHNITIKWNYSTVEKAGDGYKAILYADYEFRRTNAPDEYRNRSIQIIIHMNSYYKIISIYENQ